jgi:hypothetical protein
LALRWSAGTSHRAGTLACSSAASRRLSTGPRSWLRSVSSHDQEYHKRNHRHFNPKWRRCIRDREQRRIKHPKSSSHMTWSRPGPSHGLRPDRDSNTGPIPGEMPLVGHRAPGQIQEIIPPPSLGGIADHREDEAFRGGRHRAQADLDRERGSVLGGRPRGQNRQGRVSPVQGPLFRRNSISPVLSSGQPGELG